VLAVGGTSWAGPTEDRGVPGIAEDLRTWGWPDVREVRRDHSHPDVDMTVVWFDAP
jgi:hypothetical protein